MHSLRILSPSEQVAEYLKGELLRGRWTTSVPGVPSLAAEMGVNRKTVDAALRQLDSEGILLPQGAGRRRLIGVLPEDLSPAPLKLGIFLYEAADKRIDYIVEIQHMLMEAGHAPFFAQKSLVDLAMDVDRISQLVEVTEADAWIVIAGSKSILDWFAGQEFPTFTLFGGSRDRRFAGAGPNKGPAYRECVKSLIGAGHRRIVLLARTQRRKPVPGDSEQTFLDALEEGGIEVGEYHLPDW
ncbi:MAG: GntR family transcriptional regulator, partial [Akkermansiaceae bacterium]